MADNNKTRRGEHLSAVTFFMTGGFVNFDQLDLSQKLAFVGNALLIAGGVLLSASALVRACSTGNITGQYQFSPAGIGAAGAASPTTKTNYFDL